MKNFLLLFLILFIFGCSQSVNEKEQVESQLDTTSVSTNEQEVAKTPRTSRDNSKLPSSAIGDINYVIQDSMAVNETEEIVVTISEGLTRDEVISRVKYLEENKNNVKTNELRIAPIMSVSLIDPTGENFRIVPITPTEQFLEDNEITFWKWNVTPLNKGNNPLTLTVNVILGDKTKNVEVYEDLVYVYSTETIWDKVVYFWKSDWKWIFSTLLIPLFIWLYNKFFKKKNLN